MVQSEHRDITAVAVSFIVPVYNEAESLPEFYQKLRSEADRLDQAYEIIFIDDGSTDESAEIILGLHDQDDRVRCVTLSRRFGRSAATAAGYDYAVGSAVISIGPDARRKLDLVGELAARWRQGYEVVGAVNTRSVGQSRLRRLADRLIRLVSGMGPAEATDSRLLDRKAVQAVRLINRKGRSVEPVVRWMGFRRTSVEYELEGDEGERSGPTLRALAGTAAAEMFGSATWPLRIIGLVGGTMAAAAIAYAFFALILWPIMGGSPLANLVMLAIGLTGLQMSAVGVCGLYVARVHEEAAGRPAYVVREAVGFEPVEEKEPLEPEPAYTVPPSEPGRIRLFT